MKSNANIILVYPCSHADQPEDYRFYASIPLPLLYLSGAVRDRCGEIKLFDYNIKGNDDAAFGAVIEALMPVVVGINCMFSEIFPEVRRIAARIKQKFPAVKVVTGGIHPTLYAREIMDNCPDFDAVMMGEADTTFPLLLDYYAGNNIDNGRETELPDELDGIALRIGDRIVVREKRGYIHDLDKLPRPGYEYFDFRQYSVNTANFFNPKNIKISGVQMPLLTSRSCPNQCYFCSYTMTMGNRFRMHSAQAVFDQIKYLYDNYGINYFDIRDDNFTFNRQRTLDICGLIVKNKLEIYMYFQNGLMIRTLDDEVIDALCEAGGVHFNIAIESGNDYIRNTILKKNCGKEKIIAVADRLKSKGAIVNAFFIIGFPEETEESLKETVEMMEMLNIDGIMLQRLIPLPGARLFDRCLKDNLFTEDIKIDELWTGEYVTFQSTKDGKKRLTHFMIKPYSIDVEKLLEYEEKMNKVIKKKMMALVRSRMKNNG